MNPPRTRRCNRGRTPHNAIRMAAHGRLCGEGAASRLSPVSQKTWPMIARFDVAPSTVRCRDHDHTCFPMHSMQERRRQPPAPRFASKANTMTTIPAFAFADAGFSFLPDVAGEDPALSGKEWSHGVFETGSTLKGFKFKSSRVQKFNGRTIKDSTDWILDNSSWFVGAFRRGQGRRVQSIPAGRDVHASCRGGDVRCAA